MRKFGRTDGNQSDIVDKLRRIGCSVQLLSSVGGGCPDLLLGYCNRTYLVEVKNPDVSESDRKKTADQIIWHRDWHGQAAVCETFEDILTVLNHGNRYYNQPMRHG